MGSYLLHFVAYFSGYSFNLGRLQDIRRDFIQNEVGNHALGKHIYGYVIQVGGKLSCRVKREIMLLRARAVAGVIDASQ